MLLDVAKDRTLNGHLTFLRETYDCQRRLSIPSSVCRSKNCERTSHLRSSVEPLLGTLAATTIGCGCVLILTLFFVGLVPVLGGSNRASVRRGRQSTCQITFARVPVVLGVLITAPNWLTRVGCSALS